ncbi:MAG: NERD domain-containing protein, partial [Xanthomonadales bacterium]|nr:NERD domain-containing protein [Xanthomonadales bacterium]
MDGLLDVYLRVLLWLALAACLAVLVVPALPRLKGRIGAWRVHRRLQQALPASHYTVLRDVTVRRATATGVDTSQIDHVVVSPYG